MNNDSGMRADLSGRAGLSGRDGRSGRTGLSGRFRVLGCMRGFDWWRCNIVDVCGTGVCCLLLLVVTSLGQGCTRQSAMNQDTLSATQASEESWAAQVDAVRAGQSSVIQISQQPVTPEEFRTVRGSEDLVTLILDQGRLTDEDVDILCTLKHLQHLRLRESPISDAGLHRLAESLKELQILNLPQASITAGGISALRELPELFSLRLRGKQLNDRAVEEIARLKALTSLHLIGSDLSDASLATIASMDNLKSFYLDECELSDQAWEKFFNARPDIHVHIGQLHHDLDPNQH